MQNITILGSTGSIGKQTLEVCDWFPNDYKVNVIAAQKNYQLLAAQGLKYQPEVVAIYDESNYDKLKELLKGYNGEILVGKEAINVAAAHDTDLLVHAISGMAGLAPLMVALDKKHKIALANKESLVTAGHIVMKKVSENDITLLPVDSEHSAIFQCLMSGKSGLQNLVLTASGGPFREFTMEQLQKVTPADALNHPTWNMGAKVTIDSSTLMNKGLEVIEAHWLFDMPYDKIKVLVQPQSIIHSMAEYGDGTFIAHLGKPDMRIPIQFAMTYPQRKANSMPNLNFADLAKITFFDPDLEKFPLLKLAFEAGEAGGTLPAVMNAANEHLVYKFLRGEINYMDISYYVSKILDDHDNINNPDMETILSTQVWVKNWINKVVR